MENENLKKMFNPALKKRETIFFYYCFNYSN